MIQTRPELRNPQEPDTPLVWHALTSYALLMPARDPDLLETLRSQVERARDSGAYVEGPWIGSDNLILRSGVTRFEVRYLVREPPAPLVGVSVRTRADG